MLLEVIRLNVFQLLILFAILQNSCLIKAQDDFNWGYTDSDGPGTWKGKCATGKRQSPINIQQNSLRTQNFGKLNFVNYDKIGPVNVTDNGMTLTISGMHQWGFNWPYISGGGLKHKYQLVQFHIHWSQMDENGSEHTINGKHYPAEIHLLHIKEGQSMNDSLHQPDGIAVVSLLLNIGFNPTALSSLDGAFRTMLLPFNKGKPAVVHAFRPHSILPINTESFYRYEGSLTTPGCEESVIWTILSEHVSITNIQLALLRSIRRSEGAHIKDNTRPLQPLNGRTVLFQSSKSHFKFCDLANPLAKAFGQKFCQF